MQNMWMYKIIHSSSPGKPNKVLILKRTCAKLYLIAPALVGDGLKCQYSEPDYQRMKRYFTNTND